ncbi:MAG: Rne/Rng family ribonuclease, partial [Alphaproteobacteria bacterium]|nr:Rne/Rng family ribonuclease [Alphaproteobacteria bacterium]
MKKMLIDAAHAEETRVVLLDGSRIDDFESESSGKQQHKGNIYIGHVSRVEPSLQAAFITYGGNRNGFLAFAEVHPQYFALKAAEKAALLEEQAEQAARRRGEDEEDGAETGNAEPRREGREERQGPRQPRGGRGRPQRVESGTTATASAAAEETIRLTDTDAAPQPFYEDAEDAAAARKAAAMVDDLAKAEDGLGTAPKGKGGGKGGRGRPAKQSANSQSNEGQGGSGKRRPKRLNARRPQRQTEATAEGVEAADTAENASVKAEKTDNGKRDERPRGPIHRRYRIQDVLKEGQKILVQVVKEERGSKGAALTTYFSLPGRYTVLMSNSPNAGGISRKITDFDERRMLRDTYRALDVPATMGLIIRTAGMGQEIEAIKADYANLQQLWSHITQKFEGEDDIQCVHEDGSIIVRALRDMASQEVDEIIIAGQRAYKQAKDFAKAFMPETLKKISLYKEEAPIFSHHKVESKLLQLHHERVQLPSGGSIVINPTEALVAIDINSGRNTSERNIEETAYKTNLEATEEIARQIRLRDLAGLIVVDFIDMESYGNTRKVEQAMRRALKRDRARIQAGSISEFGLMEISRQRLRPSFAENHTVACPHCGGTGMVVSPSAAGLMLLRRLEEEDCVGADRITAAAATATVLWVLNHKRELIRSLEEKYKYLLLFKADDSLLAPDARLELTRMKADGSEVTNQVNVELREQPEVPPEKRYTKEGRAQRQREEEQREELKQAPEERQSRRDSHRDGGREQAREERRPGRAEREANRDTAPEAPKAASRATTPAKPTKVPSVKPSLMAEDQPLAVQKVAVDTSAEP